MGEKLLEIKDYSVRFTTDKVISKAVNHVNLSVDKGEVLGLVGRQGQEKRRQRFLLWDCFPNMQ